MKQIREAEDISEIAFGFMGSKALFAAIHLGVFDQLDDGPSRIVPLAKNCGIEARYLETLLTALAGLGLVDVEKGVWSNSPGARDYLVRSAKGYFGDYLSLQIDRQMYPFMTHLVPAMRGQHDRIDKASYADWMADPEEAKLFSRSQHVGSLGPGAVLAKRIDLSGARQVLDVGGGSGAFAIMMCKRYPKLSVTVLDFPNVVDIGREYVREAGFNDRIAFLPGDALGTEWPGNQDAVLMSYLFSGVNGDDVPTLVRNARRVLKPGGRIVIHDFMVRNARSGPKLAALWALQHMVFSPGAVSLTPEFVEDALRAEGFGDLEDEPLIAGMTRVVTGRLRK